MNKYTKNLLPTDWYYVKCVRSIVEAQKLLMTWKVDVGEHKWRTLKETFYLDEGGTPAVWDMCNGINYQPFEDPEDEWFALQFLGIRAKVYVDRAVDGQFKVNRIIEYKPADIPAEVNVSKPKDDSHFFENKNKRQLPIQ